jgi:uncharacterized membrane protein
MRSLKRFLLWAAILLPSMALLAGRANGQAASSTKLHIQGMHRMHGASSAAATPAANPPNIAYNGGAVLPTTTTYAIWWGKLSDFPSDAPDGIADFLEGLEGSDYIHIADQYLFGQKAHTRFGGHLFDPSTPPPSPLDAQGNDFITPELLKMLQNNGLKPDPTAVYALYTSNFPTSTPYPYPICALHGTTNSPDGTILQVAWMPNTSSVLLECGTDSDPLFKPNIHSEGTRAMASSTAHEFMETITDPNGDGWINTDGTEVGDPCNFLYLTWVPLTESKWKVQTIWSNNASRCVRGAGREARILGAFSNPRATTTFDNPAATYGPFAQAINSQGAIAGYYTQANSNNVYPTTHGFLRDKFGTVTTIDPPSATSASAFSINASGAVAGSYSDINGTHGFVRDKHGAFTTIDGPTGTTYVALATINEAGAAAGDYLDANSVLHGLIRDPQGVMTIFDAPGAANEAFGGTLVTGINSDGVIAGTYLDVNSAYRGFVRDTHGNFATFDPPGAGDLPGTGTIALSINDDGDIAGFYTDARFRNHSYIRDKHGLITTFDSPNAVYGTFAESINNDAAVAGYYSDATGFPRGFLRDKHGNFTTIDTPGKSYGTVLRSINNEGAVAGYHTAPTP